MATPTRGSSATPFMRTRDQVIVNPVVATASAIMGAGIVIMYLLVSRHLKNIEDIALTLSETLAEKVEKQAQEIATLQGYIRNTTQGVPSSLDMADTLEQQSLLLQTLLRELRNSSSHIQARLEDPSPTYQGYAQGLGGVQGRDSNGFLGASGVRGSRAGFDGELSSPTRGPNLTVLIAAGLRLQKRMHEDIERISEQMSQVGQVSSGGQGPKDTSVPGLMEMISAMKKQNTVTRAMQESLDTLTEKLEAQAEEQRNSDSTKDKRMISVLRALVTYLKVKEKRPEKDEEDQARNEEFMATVLAEVRNKTTFVSLLRTMRAQTAIMKHLGDRVGGLETKILKIQLGGSAGDEDQDGVGGGTRGGRVAEATAAAITETQNLVQILTKEVQKQSESIAELQGTLGSPGKGGGLLNGDTAALAPKVDQVLGLSRRAQQTLGTLQGALDDQSIVMRRIDVRISVLEAKVRTLAGDKGTPQGTPGEGGAGGGGGGESSGKGSGDAGYAQPEREGSAQESGGQGAGQESNSNSNSNGNGEASGAPRDPEVKKVEEAEASDVLQAVEDVVKRGKEGGGGSGGSSQAAKKRPAIKLDDEKLWRQHVFAGTDAFTRFSAHRTGARKFVALGLGATVLQDTRKVGDCKWLSKGASIPCTAELSYGLTPRNTKFETVVVSAAFDSDVPSDGGALSVSVDGDKYILYREESGAYAALSPGPTFTTKLSLCASPDVGGRVEVRTLREFVQYHQFVGVDRVWFYSVGHWDPGAASKHFASEIRAQEVWLTEFGEVAQYDMPHFGDVLALQDCAHRNVYTSEWVATAEVSEFIRVSQPPGNLPGLLDKHRGAPWVSLGSLWWSVQKCCPDFRAQGDKFSMERMIYHWPGPLCHDKVAYPDSTMCLGSAGYRKMIINPRQVATLGPHYVVTEEGAGKGVDLSTNVAIINHFQHYLKNSSSWCTDTLPSGKNIEWWARDAGFSKMVQKMRSGYKCSFSQGPCQKL